MNTIFKYLLEITDFQGIELPKGSEILSVKNQNGSIVLYAGVDTSKEKELREIQIIGTGNPVYSDSKTKRKIIDTVIMDNGLVWHVFERLSKKRLCMNTLKPTDLRIGNIINYTTQDGRVLKQVVDIYILEKIVNNPDHNYSGVVLDEDELLKFGFSDEEYKPGYIGVDFKNTVTLSFVLSKPGKMGVWQEHYAYEMKSNMHVEIPTVHELQNLFKTLTTQELDYKL